MCKKISAEEFKKFGRQWQWVHWPLKDMVSESKRLEYLAETKDGCDICNGNRKVYVEDGDDYILRKCECNSRFHRLIGLHTSGIPPFFHDFKLSDYKDPLRSQNQSSIDVIKNYVRRFDTYKKTGQGLLITGPCGTGKTSLATMVGKLLLRDGYSVLYYKLSQFVSRKFMSLDDSHELDRMRAIIEGIDLLIMDEVDKYAGSTNDMVNVFLDDVFGTRYDNFGPLIVIGNADREHLNLPEFILDRFEEILIDVPFVGESHRKKLAQQRMAKEAALTC